LAAPRPSSSRFGSMRWRLRPANVRDSTLVSAKDTSAIPTLATASSGRSATVTLLTLGSGKPRGTGPTTSMPGKPKVDVASAASAIDKSNQGTRGASRLPARITARAVAPIARAAGRVSPRATP
jgi:hypothetical protein